jgi:PAS domain S-box-containing protein
MHKYPKNYQQMPRLRLYAGLLVIAWTLTNGASLWWNLKQNEREIHDIALIAVKINADKDNLYRLWVSSHGGIYVPVTPQTPPNPYLSHIPERDLVTPSGKSLTLFNFAYLNRQVHELGKEEYGIQGHITSLNPIRPENAPDAWETEALKALGQEPKEFSSIAELKGEPYLRLMRPFLVDKSCLKCHAGQGYKEGDIRGGVSLSIPLAPLQAAKLHTKNLIWLSHGLIWFFGLVGIMWGSRRLDQSLKEQANIQQELIVSEARYRTLVENVDFGIALIDSNYRVIWANKGIEKIYRKPLTEIIGQECFRVFKGENEACPDCLGEKAMATGKPVVGTSVGVRADETRFTIYLHAFPYYDEEGKLRGFIEVIEDISEKKKLEDELLKAKKLEAAAILAGGIAHDFNNLFGVILGSISMARMALDPGNAAIPSLQEAERAVLHATDLTRKFITFATSSAPITSLISLPAIILDAVAQAMSDSDLNVEYDLPEDLWQVEGEAGQISQAITNITVNAKEAMPAGGTIKVSATNIRFGSENITPEPNMPAGKYVKITIIDQGVGISTDNLSKIFDPYFSTKDKFAQKGLGMGLTLAYALIKKNGGYITVESEVKMGTSCNIYLPVINNMIGKNSHDE